MKRLSAAWRALVQLWRESGCVHHWQSQGLLFDLDRMARYQPVDKCARCGKVSREASK